MTVFITWTCSFAGQTDKVVMDSNGDRVPNFLVWNFESGYDSYNQYMKIDLGNAVNPVRLSRLFQRGNSRIWRIP
jgi:outer membrane receptor for Fe3+-dicitrate